MKWLHWATVLGRPVSNSLDMVRLILATLLISSAANASAQLSGRFYLDKSTFAAGEPVFLYFEVTNDGTEPVNIFQADPYSFCSGYQVKLHSGSESNTSCSPYGVAGSCLSSDTLLPAGKKYVQRLLLNFEHDLNSPGEYSVEVSRALPSASAKLEYYEAPKDTLEVRDTLHFAVDSNATLESKTLQPWVEQLQSRDASKRREAARTLAGIAPPQLDDTLLTFADVAEFRQFAPLAFHRLNTSRSIAALASLVKQAQPGSNEHSESAQYLAASGDQQWFPLLQEVAMENAQNSIYPDYAATLGGEKMLPTLISLMNCSDRQCARVSAVTAMGFTGSRAAVPILIELLKNPDPDVADRTRYALRLLTHRSVSKENADSPQSEYPAWSRWWALEGPSAPIYKASDCGEVTELH